MLHCWRVVVAVRRCLSSSSSSRSGAAATTTTTMRVQRVCIGSGGGGGKTMHSFAPGSSVDYDRNDARESRRQQLGACTTTGRQMIITSGPGDTSMVDFAHNVLEHVRVPELPASVRASSDMARTRAMRERYGDGGPGEPPQKSAVKLRRDMLQQQQDIDGMPWEVRARRSMVPTLEEVTQELRDRFDLFVQDPIEREKMWYLHWKDRSMNIHPDRLIWPQGDTHYLDIYDADGKRRVVPGAQAWHAQTHMHLEDEHFRDRLWRVDAEGASQTALPPLPTFPAQQQQLQLQQQQSMEQQPQGQAAPSAHELPWPHAGQSTPSASPDMYHEQLAMMDDHFYRQAELMQSVSSGVVDPSGDEVSELLSGTADPRVVTATQRTIDSYHALSPLSTRGELHRLQRVEDEAAAAAAAAGTKAEDSKNGVMQPVRGRAAAAEAARAALGARMLPSGVTVAQAAHVTASTFARDGIETTVVSQAHDSGRDGEAVRLERAREAARQRGDRPAVRVDVQAYLDATRQRNAAAAAAQLSADKGVAATTTTATTKAAANTSRHDEGYMTATPRPPGAEPVVAPEMIVTPRELASSSSSSTTTAAAAAEHPAWYRETVLQTQPLIRHYDLTHDPLETQDVVVHANTPHDDDDNDNDNATARVVVRDYYTPPRLRDEDRVTYDDVREGESAFDEAKLRMLRATPELASAAYGSPAAHAYAPLPLFREAQATAAAHGDNKADADATLPKSVRLRRERQARVRRAHAQSHVAPLDLAADAAAHNAHDDGNESADKDSSTDDSNNTHAGVDGTPAAAARKYNVDHLLLPTLPWERGVIDDPMRGVATADSEPVDVAHLHAVWSVYRGVLAQTVSETITLAKASNMDAVARMYHDVMVRFRSGHVGEYAALPPRQEAVLRLLYESYARQLLAEVLSSSGDDAAHYTEAKALRSEAEAQQQRALAQSKLLGPSFMTFLQQVCTQELDRARQNPLHRHRIAVTSRKHLVFVQPFVKWMHEHLLPFAKPAPPPPAPPASSSSSSSHDGSTRQTQPPLSLPAPSPSWTPEQIDLHASFLERTANATKERCARHLVEGVSSSTREALVSACHAWCRGAIAHYTATHYMNLYLQHADSRFRGRAEELYEDAVEYFTGYANISSGTDSASDGAEGGNKGGSGRARSGRLVHIPIPNTEPPSTYVEREFLDGESAVHAEAAGQFERAEALWHSGTTRRWYHMYDETEYMLYCERRGRLTLALQVSDRCLEHMNKRTHPSLHPLPERAHVFLEHAPLSRETAEHLWLRHMAALHHEHAAMAQRNGRYQTAQVYTQRALNLSRAALRTAHERLPPTWTAPLLTRAQYLMHAYKTYTSGMHDGSSGDGGDDDTVSASGGRDDAVDKQNDGDATTTTTADAYRGVAAHLRDVEAVVDALLALPEPPHWADAEMQLPQRVALVHANIAAYGLHIAGETARRMQHESQASLTYHRGSNSGSNTLLPPTDEQLQQLLAHRAYGTSSRSDNNDNNDPVAQYERIGYDVAEDVYRRKILAWRARDAAAASPHSLLYHFWTHLYFAFRVCPRDAAAVRTLWAMYKPTYEFIYTNCALGVRTFGEDTLAPALRTCCHILLRGDAAQLDELHAVLSRARDCMPHLVDPDEMERTLCALQRRRDGDTASPVYAYGNMALYAHTVHVRQQYDNPLLHSQLAADEYAQLKARERQLNAQSSATLRPHLQASSTTSSLPSDNDGSSSGSVSGGQASGSDDAMTLRNLHTRELLTQERML